MSLKTNHTNCSSSSASSSSNVEHHFPEPFEFRPKKVLVIGKFSRLEFEKHRNPDLSDKELAEYVSIIIMMIFKFKFDFSLFLF